MAKPTYAELEAVVRALSEKGQDATKRAAEGRTWRGFCMTNNYCVGHTRFRADRLDAYHEDDCIFALAESLAERLDDE